MSPISAENKHRYPKDWPEISRAIKERAGWCCECVGECGSPGHGPCGREHGEHVPRSSVLPDGTVEVYRVVLTVAHLNHEPEDCREENLKALCQLCHLRYDAEHHRESARRTREKKNGTEPLFALGGSKEDKHG